MKRLIALLFVPLAMSAQRPAVVQLTAPNGRLSESFARQPLNDQLEAPRDLYELSDGRVLVMDGLRLLVGDPSTGKTTVVAGAKSGALYRLAADSGFITGSDGWFFLEGTRSIGMLPTTNPIVSATSRDGTSITGADNRGFLLVREEPKRRGDSALAVLVNRRSGERTVVGRLHAPSPQQGIFRPVCLQAERAVLARDGWLAILRADPYRVDWRDPSGKWILGAPIPGPDTPMTPAERRIYQDWRARERPLRAQDSVQSWPEKVCPWTSGYAPIPTPDGKLLVYRVPTTAAPLTRYDIVNRNGEVERQLALSANEAVLGFGQRSIYVLVDDGQSQTIRRHPWR